MNREVLNGQFPEKEMPDGEHIVKDSRIGEVMVGNYPVDRKEQYLLRQRTAVVSALSNIFSDMYYIDLEENTIQKVASGNLMKYEYDKDQDAREALRTLADTQVQGAFRPIVRNFLDFDTLDARMGDKKIITQEYVDDKGEWIRCSIMPAERDRNGENIALLCVMRPVTAEKKELESQDSLIQALAIPYENTYAVNAETGESVCYRMGQTMAERYGHKFSVGDYEENICSYIDNDVKRTVCFLTSSALCER